MPSIVHSRRAITLHEGVPYEIDPDKQNDPGRFGGDHGNRHDFLRQPDAHADSYANADTNPLSNSSGQPIPGSDALLNEAGTLCSEWQELDSL